uniref:Uncharacterized protein n=1 Tax=Oryza nivara TaxID=4536 RepID=A0A0E0HAQ6_ORYNI
MAEWWWPWLQLQYKKKKKIRNGSRYVTLNLAHPQENDDQRVFSSYKAYGKAELKQQNKRSHQGRGMVTIRLRKYTKEAMTKGTADFLNAHKENHP